jgi:hypothetical protein
MAHAQGSMQVHLSGFEISYLEAPLRLATKLPLFGSAADEVHQAGETKENAELEETLW